MLVLSVGLVVLGIALLYWGGEVLVDSSIALARHFGLSPLAIGLTVVAFATSAPELAAALTATLLGAPDLALGNAVGSNIANVGLILGATALFFALPATGRFVRRELAFMLVVTVILYPVLATSGSISRLEGVALFGILVVFLHGMLRDPGSQQTWDEAEEGEDDPLWKSLMGVALGIVLLVGGAKALVDGASDIALALGVPERVIGLTLVALGTSLPELAASIAAGRKNQADLVLGNVVGSNIFNLLCILGLTSIVVPIRVAPDIVRLDFWVMLGISILLAAFLGLRGKLSRGEGAVLLALYVGYSIYLYLPSSATP
ncbi:MAG: calcium/sodium antiporter [Acidobacteriota bacterium]